MPRLSDPAARRRDEREDVARAGTDVHFDVAAFTSALQAAPPDAPVDGHRQLTVRLPIPLRAALEDYSRDVTRGSGKRISDRAVVQALLEQLLADALRARTHADAHDGGQS